MSARKRGTRRPQWIRRELRLAVYCRDGWACVYCARGAEAPGVSLSLDHVRPRTRGGTNAPRNLVTSCSTCNTAKHDRRASDLSSTWIAENWPEPAEIRRRVRNATRRAVDRALGVRMLAARP